MLIDGYHLGVPNYVPDKTMTGGVWGGTRAVVIFVDGSGRVMKCDGGTPAASFVERPSQTYSITDNTKGAPPDNWLSATNLVLEPAGAGP